MTKPNLFIVGAPKAGTTSLYRYLQEHPEVFFPELKEPHFFNTDTNNIGSLEDIKSYKALFKDAKNETYVGEASTHYLMSEKAPINIKQFSPDAKIIIMLRKPYNIIYSAYMQNVYNGIEPLNTLEEALEAEHQRRIAKNDQISFAESFHLLYSRFVQYEKYLKKYFSVFDRENIHIIFFDDFINQTEKEYTDVLDFLSLQNMQSLNFENYNASKKIKSKFLRSMMKKPPKGVRFLGTFLPKNSKLRIMRFLKKKNTLYIKKEPLSNETKMMLTQKYIPEVENLEKLLEVDLSHWKV